MMARRTPGYRLSYADWMVGCSSSKSSIESSRALSEDKVEYSCDPTTIIAVKAFIGVGRGWVWSAD
jgi:hypothetical protein